MENNKVIEDMVNDGIRSLVVLDKNNNIIEEFHLNDDYTYFFKNTNINKNKIYLDKFINLLKR
jgi:hypothetical protein